MRSFINLNVIFKSFGLSLLIIGLMKLTAIYFAWYYSENTIIPILLASFVSTSCGLIMLLFSYKKETQHFKQRESYIIVTGTWFMLGVFGALPYIFTGSIVNFTDAYFETISGFTTTGASILTDIEALPKSILYWRSLTQWLGGIGILVIVIAVLPTMGYGGVKLFVAEITGPTSNKLHPKIRTTAIFLIQIYGVLTVILILLLMFGGMNFFESVSHSLATLSTGGFSPKNRSIADYSAYIQIVITVFMLFGGLNFAIHYYLIKGKFKKVFSNQELQMFVLLIFTISVINALLLIFNNTSYTTAEAFRHSFFQIISVVTTTGFVTTDWMLWSQSSWFLLLLMFFVGGMIGSTAGGIKFTRHLILLKNIRNEVKRIVHPNSITSIKLNKIIIPDDVVKNFFLIFIAYFVIFIIGTLALSFFIDSPKEAVSVSISCLAAVGPAFGEFGPVGNYSELHDIGKWICSVLMIIGRLEVIAFISLFYVSFWKK